MCTTNEAGRATWPEDLGPTTPSTPWTQTYHGLKNNTIDPATRPDMLVADFFVSAVKNARMEYKAPIVFGWPQMHD